MAKQKAPSKISNRATFSRMSYLYQAASYLATAEVQKLPAEDKVTSNNEDSGGRNMARRLVSDMRAVGLKTQVRIDPNIKQSVCKYCDTLLLEGQTCTSFVENKSKNGKKPWADVLVIRCKTCTREKRFPASVSAIRQKRRHLRQATRVEDQTDCLRQDKTMGLKEPAAQEQPTADAEMKTD